MIARNVFLAVADSFGDLYCVTFADNNPEQIAAFRRHAQWWRGYAQSAEGRERLRAAGRYPCAPFRTIVEPYADGERPPSLGT